MKIKRFFLIFLATMLAACGSRKGRNAFQSAQYRIAYNVLADPETDDYEILTMNLDGSDKKNVTNHPGLEWTYYAYRDKILFISDRDTCRRCYFLYEMDADGENVRKASGTRLADSWMSGRNNGAELIATPHRSVDSAFYILNKQGEVLDKLYTGLPYSGDPLFVNGGKQVVFRGGLTKSKLIDGFNEELYLINVDGTGRRQLTHYPEGDTTAGQFGYHAGTPVEHPTERFISYQSKQNGKYSLYAVTLDGKKHWKLTDTPQNEGWHAWSPDGRWLAIELFDDDQSQFHIGLMDWQTKEMKILTDTTYQYQQAPVFVAP
ncbi:MAG: PD40 domain-containing protein [Lewinellaceae bacterium]|nr:PD40 domain-containing protein [Lewinellaceae bacterium]